MEEPIAPTTLRTLDDWDDWLLELGFSVPDHLWKCVEIDNGILYYRSGGKNSEWLALESISTASSGGQPTSASELAKTITRLVPDPLRPLERDASFEDWYHKQWGFVEVRKICSHTSLPENHGSHEAEESQVVASAVEGEV